MPAPLISLYSGVTPNRNQSPNDFANNADDWLNYQSPLAVEYNNLAVYLNDLSIVVEFNSTTELIGSTSASSVGDLASVNGFLVKGDGGKAQWQRTAITGQTPSQTPVQLDGAILNDGNGVQWKLLSRGYVDSRVFGAIVGQESTLSIEVAIKSVDTKINDGEYIVSDIGATTVALSLSGIARRRIKGNGSIKLADNQDAHILNIDQCNDILLKGVKFDGNGANQTAGHAIRMDNCFNIKVHNLSILDSQHYGVGLQVGSFKDISLKGLRIKNPGGDGIDIKNHNDDNWGIVIDDIFIENPGNIAATQAGIDCRGKCELSNITVVGLTDGHTGIRFREGIIASTSGLGAHKSSLTNYYVDGDNIGTTSIGVYNGGDNVSISNGACEDVGIGFQDRSTANNSTYSNIHAKDCLFKGIWLSSDDTSVVGAVSDNCVEGARIQGLNTTITNGTFVNSPSNMRINTGAEGTQISGGRIDGVVNDLSTGAELIKVRGQKNESNTESAILAVDSTGSKTFVVPHGLDITPDAKDISLTLLRETAVNDYAVSFIRVDVVDATNVTGRLMVATASATGGATAKVGIKISK